MAGRARGFTLVELVMVIIILGILAVVALPRLNVSGYRELEFHDRVVGALRFAQKSAVSHRRPVRVSFPDNAYTLALEIDTDRNGSWRSLVLPGATSHKVVSSDPGNVYFAPVPVAWQFAPDGSASDCTARAGGLCVVNITGTASVSVVGATGYVQ